MSHLKTFIENHNRFAKLFGDRTFDLTTLTQDDANKLFYKIDSEMSPENLHCDGEITAAQARQKARVFMGAAAQLDALGFQRPADLYCI